MFILAIMSAALGSGSLSAPAIAQVDRVLRGARDRVSPADVAAIVRGRQSLETGIQHALSEASALDGFAPMDTTPLGTLPRGPNGEFRLITPGTYDFTPEGFCLRAGTYVPDRGAGLLHAPLIGTKATTIRNILRGATRHPDVTYWKVQYLLWAVLSGASLSSLSDDLQVAAARLLGPAELLELEGWSVNAVQERALATVIRQMPEAIRAPFEAEARIREMLRSGEASFQELERVAVLTGAVPPSSEDRVIPSRRWTYHPRGYFLGLEKTCCIYATSVHVLVPEPTRTTRDRWGRLDKIVTTRGDEVRIAYDPPSPGSEPTSANPARALRLRHLGSSDPGRVQELVPTAPGDSARRSRSFIPSIPLTWERLVASVTAYGTPAPDTLARTPERQSVADLDYLLERLPSGPSEASAIRRILQEAWAWHYCAAVGGCVTPSTRTRTGLDLRQGLFRLAALPDGLSADKFYEPAENVAVPGSIRGQRIGQAGRCEGHSDGTPNPDCIDCGDAGDTIDRLRRGIAALEGVAAGLAGELRLAEARRDEILKGIGGLEGSLGKASRALLDVAGTAGKARRVVQAVGETTSHVGNIASGTPFNSLADMVKGDAMEATERELMSTVARESMSEYLECRAGNVVSEIRRRNCARTASQDYRRKANRGRGVLRFVVGARDLIELARSTNALKDDVFDLLGAANELEELRKQGKDIGQRIADKTAQIEALKSRCRHYLPPDRMSQDPLRRIQHARLPGTQAGFLAGSPDDELARVASLVAAYENLTTLSRMLEELFDHLAANVFPTLSPFIADTWPLLDREILLQLLMDGQPGLLRWVQSIDDLVHQGRRADELVRAGLVEAREV
jgi:hypothetical protein